jgi:hypothetical protein
MAIVLSEAQERVLMANAQDDLVYEQVSMLRPSFCRSRYEFLNKFEFCRY